MYDPDSISTGLGVDVEPAGHLITVSVNGVSRQHVVDDRLTLADFLRERLRLTGTHLGCEHGVCGACTVIVNGVSARSCLMLAVQADDAEIETVEGLAPEGELAPVQQAFKDNHALQCGFCTPGFLMSLTAALREGPIRDERTAREVLSGNICRCTGYTGLVQAVLDAGADADAQDETDSAGNATAIGEPGTHGLTEAKGETDSKGAGA
jgi:aerobic-type carbon monoxide dehydrogenase small subunit (CoxS/CutS family)